MIPATVNVPVRMIARPQQLLAASGLIRALNIRDLRTVPIAERLALERSRLMAQVNLGSRASISIPMRGKKCALRTKWL